MRGQSSIEYHHVRAAAELKRAAEATDAKTAALHRQLAELHLLSAGDSDDLDRTATSLAPSDLAAASGR